MTEIVSVEWGGYTLMEPMTFITDVLITVFSFYFSFILLKKGDQKVYRLWSFYFFLTGLSTMIGGTAHLLAHYYGKSLHLVSWFVTGISVMVAEMAVVHQFYKQRVRPFSIFAALQFAVFLVCLFHFKSFNAVVVNSVVGLFFVVTGIHFLQFRKTGDQGSKLIALGYLCCLPTVAINALRLNPHPWFTSHDINHFIIILSLWIIYRGVLKTQLVDALTDLGMPKELNGSADKIA